MAAPIPSDVKKIITFIVKGYFNEGRPIQFVETARVPIALGNVGVTAVVPSYLPHEILFSDELKKQRAKTQ